MLLPKIEVVESLQGLLCLVRPIVPELCFIAEGVECRAQSHLPDPVYCGAPKPQRRSDDENGTTLINQSMYIFKSMQAVWYNMIHQGHATHSLSRKPEVGDVRTNSLRLTDNCYVEMI